VVNGFLYAVGGYNGNFVNLFLSTVEAYDPRGNTWTVEAPMPTASAGLGAGVVNGVLYGIGGFASGNTLATNQAFIVSDNDSGFSQLNGGNTFNGDQMVNGTVSATTFVGNGSGLTNLNAAQVGGIPATSYARLDIGNSFIGNQTVTG